LVSLPDGPADVALGAALERERATDLVPGHRPRGRWQRFTESHLVDTVMRQRAIADCFLVRLDMA